VRLDGPKENPEMLTELLARGELASLTGAKTLRLDSPINTTIKNVKISLLFNMQTHPYIELLTPNN
jgi:hypothetical protein